MEKVTKIALCGPHGPDGISTLVQGHYYGIKAALEGDNVGVAKAGAGVWGSLSGGVIGFVLGGPVGAFIGGCIVGFAASEGAGALVKSQMAPAGATHEPEYEVHLAPGFLGKFLRQPRITVGNTALNNHSFFGTQENNRYPVGFDPKTPSTVYVYHHVQHVGDMWSSFTLLANGNLKETNETLREEWTWVPTQLDVEK